jgi:hypothetical protein
MAARPDPTNAERQRRHRLRQRALAAALAAPAAADGINGPGGRGREGDPDRASVRGAIDHLRRLDRRHATETARHVFAAAIEDNAHAVAERLIRQALAGDVAALTLVARSVLPAARPDDRRVRLDLPPLTSPENVAQARRRVAEAVARGEVGLGDGRDLMTLLEGLAAALAEAEKRALLTRLRGALAGAEAGGVRTRITLLAQEAEVFVEAARQVPCGGAADTAVPSLLVAEVPG